MGTLHKDLDTLMVKSRSIILRLRNISRRVSEKSKHTQFKFINISTPPPPHRKSYGLWNNMEKYGGSRDTTDDNMLWRMFFACWINKATHTHSDYVIHIGFPRQRYLHERVSMLRLYLRCLSVLKNVSYFCFKICFCSMTGKANEIVLPLF
jgi:hypothetical protein